MKTNVVVDNSFFKSIDNWSNNLIGLKSPINNTHPSMFEDDEEMIDKKVIKTPVLVRYLVAGNIFEVTEKYELQYAIGQGAYGIVCSAKDLELNEQAAIKVTIYF